VLVLPDDIHVALRGVAARAAHAAAVSRLACASKAARAQANAALPAPARAARHAKLLALCKMLAAAHKVLVHDDPAVGAALINLCADAYTVPPPATAAAPAADEAAQWRALAQMADAQLLAEPDTHERALLSALATLQAPFGGAAADDESLLRDWRAARFAAWLTGVPESEYESDDQDP
jgi:hypothetical protein